MAAIVFGPEVEFYRCVVKVLEQRFSSDTLGLARFGRKEQAREPFSLDPFGVLNTRGYTVVAIYVGYKESVMTKKVRRYVSRSHIRWHDSKLLDVHLIRNPESGGTTCDWISGWRDE